MSQELAPNQRPAWSQAAALFGFCATSTAAWAAWCAVPQYQHYMPKGYGQNAFAIMGLGALGGYYCGGRYTGLTPVETEARYVQLRAEAAQKKIDDEIKAAKKAADEAKKNKV